MTIKRTIENENGKTPVEITLTDDEIIRAYFECVLKREDADRSGDFKQWISDFYHNSGMWGQKITAEEMLFFLAETRRQTEPDEYVPDISLYLECAVYWNELCVKYPK